MRTAGDHPYFERAIAVRQSDLDVEHARLTIRGRGNFRYSADEGPSLNASTSTGTGASHSEVCEHAIGNAKIDLHHARVVERERKRTRGDQAAGFDILFDDHSGHRRDQVRIASPICAEVF